MKQNCNKCNKDFLKNDHYKKILKKKSIREMLGMHFHYKLNTLCVCVCV